MEPYLNLMRLILEEGETKGDRTGTGTLSVFGHQMRFNLEEGFPMVTTKKLHLRSIIHELLWFLKGDTNIKYLKDNKVTIWDEWADENGNLGPVYGEQWRKWKTSDGSTIDQMKELIENIKNNPNSRRHIISAWNPSELKKMALPPCHAFFQLYVDTDSNELSCQLYQRSADVALGVPFNIASYALLMMMIAQTTNLIPGVFTHTIGDAHLYLNHIEGIKKQIEREPLKLPSVTIADKHLNELLFEDIKLHDYEHHPFIRFEVAV